MISFKGIFLAIKDLFEGDSAVHQLTSRLKFYQDRLEEVAKAQVAMTAELNKLVNEMNNTTEMLNTASKQIIETMNATDEINKLTEQLKQSNDTLSEELNTKKTRRK